MVLHNGVLAHRIGASAAAGANPFGDFTYEEAKTNGWLFDPNGDGYYTLGSSQTLAAFLDGGTTLTQPAFQNTNAAAGRVDTAAADTPTVVREGNNRSNYWGLQCWNEISQSTILNMSDSSNYHNWNITRTTDGTLAAHPAHLATKAQATSGDPWTSYFRYDGDGAYPGMGFTLNRFSAGSFFFKKGNSNAFSFKATDDVSPWADLYHINITFSGTVPTINYIAGNAADKYGFLEDIGGGWYKCCYFFKPTYDTGGRLVWFPDTNSGTAFTYFYCSNYDRGSTSSGGRGIRGNCPSFYLGNPFGGLVNKTGYRKTCASWYNYQHTGTFLMEFQSTDPQSGRDAGRQRTLCTGYNITTDRWDVYCGRSSGTEPMFSLHVRRGSSSQYTHSTINGAFNHRGWHTIAMRAGAYDWALACDGVMHIENTTINCPSLLGDFGFGGNGFGPGGNLDGYIRMAAYFPGKATNAELMALSSLSEQWAGR